MSEPEDELQLHATDFGGHREVSFDLPRRIGGPLHIELSRDGLYVEGMRYEGDTSIVLPLSAIRRALALLDEKEGV